MSSPTTHVRVAAATLPLAVLGAALMPATATAASSAQPAAAPAQPQAAAPGVRPDLATWSAPLFPCRGYEGFDAQNPRDSAVKDIFTFTPYKPTRVGNGKGDINWRANPYGNATWRMWLHSLRWIGGLINAAPGDEVATAHALAIVRDWSNDNRFPWTKNADAAEPTMHRLNVLLCLRLKLTADSNKPLPKSQRWLDSVIVTHMRQLQVRWSGAGNHGTDESGAMLRAACTLGNSTYRDLAVKRLASTLPVAVDSQGTTNEQSTGYANMNYALWMKVSGVLVNCRTPGTRKLARAIRARIAPMPAFLAHAHAPDGTMEQIGDTQRKHYGPMTGTPQEYPATSGKRGTPPRNRVAVYRGGFVFGRNSWGKKAQPYPETTYYTLRFGPPRKWHGHNDHTAISLWARGDKVLIDPGYGVTSKRRIAAVFGPDRHNTLTASGMTINGTQTTLNSYTLGKVHEAYRMSDTPVKGMSRLRGVLVDHSNSAASIVVVRDVATTGRATTFSQNWQHPIGTRLTQISTSTRVATHPSTRTYLVTLSPHLTRTTTNPVWLSYFHEQSHPTTLVIQRGTKRADILTVLVTVDSGAGAPRVTARKGVITVVVGGKVSRYSLVRTGDIRLVSSAQAAVQAQGAMPGDLQRSAVPETVPAPSAPVESAPESTVPLPAPVKPVPEPDPSTLLNPEP